MSSIGPSGTSGRGAPPTSPTSSATSQNSGGAGAIPLSEGGGPPMSVGGSTAESLLKMQSARSETMSLQSALQQTLECWPHASTQTLKSLGDLSASKLQFEMAHVQSAAQEMIALQSPQAQNEAQERLANLTQGLLERTVSLFPASGRRDERGYVLLQGRDAAARLGAQPELTEGVLGNASKGSPSDLAEKMGRSLAQALSPIVETMDLVPVFSALKAAHSESLDDFSRQAAASASKEKPQADKSAADSVAKGDSKADADKAPGSFIEASSWSGGDDGGGHKDSDGSQKDEDEEENVEGIKQHRKGEPELGAWQSPIYWFQTALSESSGFAQGGGVGNAPQTPPLIQAGTAGNPATLPIVTNQNISGAMAVVFAQHAALLTQTLTTLTTLVQNANIVFKLLSDAFSAYMNYLSQNAGDKGKTDKNLNIDSGAFIDALLGHPLGSAKLPDGWESMAVPFLTTPPGQVIGTLYQYNMGTYNGHPVTKWIFVPNDAFGQLSPLEKAVILETVIPKYFADHPELAGTYSAQGLSVFDMFLYCTGGLLATAGGSVDWTQNQTYDTTAILQSTMNQYMDVQSNNLEGQLAPISDLQKKYEDAIKAANKFVRDLLSRVLQALDSSAAS